MRKKEKWKIIYGFPNYKISTWGRVKSMGRLKKMPTGGFHIIPEKIMSTKKVKKYNCIKLCKDGKHFSLRVARLVGLHFIKNPFNKPLINHLDTDKNNDYYKNLEWTDESGNMKHAYKNGLMKMPWQNKKLKNGKFYPIIIKKAA